MNLLLTSAQTVSKIHTVIDDTFINKLVHALKNLDFEAVELLAKDLEEDQGFNFSNKMEFISFDEELIENDIEEQTYDYSDIIDIDKYEFLASMQRFIGQMKSLQPNLPLAIERANCYGCKKDKNCPHSSLYSFIDNSVSKEDNPVVFSFYFENNAEGELTEIYECRYAMPHTLKDHPALQYLYTADWKKDMMPF